MAVRPRRVHRRWPDSPDDRHHLRSQPHMAPSWLTDRSLTVGGRSSRVPSDSDHGQRHRQPTPGHGGALGRGGPIHIPAIPGSPRHRASRPGPPDGRSGQLTTDRRPRSGASKRIDQRSRDGVSKRRRRDLLERRSCHRNQHRPYKHRPRRAHSVQRVAGSGRLPWRRPPRFHVPGIGGPNVAALLRPLPRRRALPMGSPRPRGPIRLPLRNLGRLHSGAPAPDRRLPPRHRLRRRLPRHRRRLELERCQVSSPGLVKPENATGPRVTSPDAVQHISGALVSRPDRANRPASLSALSEALRPALEQLPARKQCTQQLSSPNNRGSGADQPAVKRRSPSLVTVRGAP
jgi:hypothetical protein